MPSAPRRRPRRRATRRPGRAPRPPRLRVRAATAGDRRHSPDAARPPARSILAGLVVDAHPSTAAVGRRRRRRRLEDRGRRPFVGVSALAQRRSSRATTSSSSSKRDGCFRAAVKILDDLEIVGAQGAREPAPIARSGGPGDAEGVTARRPAPRRRPRYRHRHYGCAGRRPRTPLRRARPRYDSIVLDAVQVPRDITCVGSKDRRSTSASIMCAPRTHACRGRGPSRNPGDTVEPSSASFAGIRAPRPVGGGVFVSLSEHTMPTAKKEATIEELREKIASAKNLFFTNYQGLTVEEITQAPQRAPQRRQHLRRREEHALQACGGRRARFAARRDSRGSDRRRLRRRRSRRAGQGPQDVLGQHQAVARQGRLHRRQARRCGPSSRARRASPKARAAREDSSGRSRAPLYGLVYVLSGNQSGLVRVLNAIREQKERGSARRRNQEHPDHHGSRRTHRTNRQTHRPRARGPRQTARREVRR